MVVRKFERKNLRAARLEAFHKDPVEVHSRVIKPTATLLGSMLVSQIQLAAMRRSAIPPEQRVPFTLYVDELQNFMSSAFEKILSEARKYNLGLVMAHQYITQLEDKVRHANLCQHLHSHLFPDQPAGCPGRALGNRQLYP